MKKLILFLLFSTLLYSGEIQDSIKNDYMKSYDYERMQKYSEAIKVLMPLYQKYEKNYTLNLRFGWLFFMDKKYANALQYYKQASLLNPYAIDPKLGLIRVYFAKGSLENVQTIAYEILKIDYYNYYANLFIIKAFIAQEKYTIALTMINKMLLLYPLDISYLEQLSIVYKLTNDERLEQLYADILILDPNNVLVRSNMLTLKSLK